MSPRTLTDSDLDSRLDLRGSLQQASQTTASGAADLRHLSEDSTRDPVPVIVWTTVALGLAVRLWISRKNYLNPDEAIHYLLINQPSAFLAYKASLTNAHPPLLFLLVYFWHFLGRSEFMLRLPSVLAGTASCWVTFKWLELYFGRTAALIGLVLAAFSPAMIILSTELREYALLLLCMSAALYFLGRAFQEKSSRDMAYFSVLLYLAILSHYSAVFFAFTVGLYAVVRIADSHLPRKVVAGWVAGQVGALAIYAFLYWSQVSKLKPVIPHWAQPWDRFYFRLGYVGYADLFDFLRDNTVGIFKYMFYDEHVAKAMLLFFVAAVVLLFVRGLIPAKGKPRSCHLGILVTLPFLAVWGASMTGIYPYVGSRHTIFLAPFYLAALSFLFAAMVGKRLWAGVLIAGLVAGFSNASARPFASHLAAEDQRRPLIVEGVAEIRRSIPKNELIFVDYQSTSLLAYYLCGPERIVQIDMSLVVFYQFECGGYKIVSLEYHLWKLTPAALANQGKKMAQLYGLKSGDRFWVFQAGWGLNLDTELPTHYPHFRCLPSKSFGSVTVIPLVLSPALVPESPVKDCQGVAALLHRGVVDLPRNLVSGRAAERTADQGIRL